MPQAKLCDDGRLTRFNHPLHKVVSHFAFSPITPYEGTDIGFGMYANMLPASEPDCAYFPLSTPRVYLVRNTQDTHWLLGPIKPYGSKSRDADNPEKEYVLPSDPDELVQELEAILASKYTVFCEAFDRELCRDLKRTAIPASISYVIRKQLRGNATLYNYHRTFTTERLLDIDGVGEKTADILKKQGTIYCRDTGPTHYSHVVCSSCGVEFRAPYRSHMSISMKTLSHVVYCPNCQHDTIPITHISRPKPFTPGIDSE